MIIPPGDSRERSVCSDCNHIQYDNPKIVTLAVPVCDDKILLCRRGIQPRVGFWTLPGGYMENGETVQEGAARETMEEAGAKVEVGPLLAVYHTPDRRHVMLIFRAEMDAPVADPGPESQEVKFFAWEDIPWNELAFPMVEHALKAYERTKDMKEFAPEIAVMPPIKGPLMPPPAQKQKPPSP